MKLIKTIAVVGGGTSGWLSAAYLSRQFPDIKIILIDKQKGTPVGVGEGTLLNFQKFMESCGLARYEWFNEIQAVNKAGILFPKFKSDNHEIWHPFDFKGSFDDWSRRQSASFKHEVLSLYETSVREKQVVESKINSYALHVDCTLLALYIKLKLKNKILFIDSEVKDQIRKLGFGIFDPFGHLRTLDISHNEIGNIDHGPFITLRSLEVLDVSWNSVPIVKRDWFAQDDWETAEKPLKELYLNNNAIKHIDKEAFWPLKNLEKLDISANRIFALNETVFKELSTLREISIHSNPLHNISKSLFSSLNQIKVLDVSQTCLTEIVPFTFDGMTALEKLDLSGGFIRTIYPESFNGSGDISILNISYNNITTLEHSVFTQLSDSLEVLLLDHNALTIEGLGDNLDLVNNLRILDLSHNNLQNIHGEASLRQKGVLLKIMANPILCDCSTSWFANFETLADFEEVLCESPSPFNGQAAVCFEFPPECSQMPVAQMYITYCANRPDTVHQQNDNTSRSNNTGIEEHNAPSVKGIDDYIAYCFEPEIPSTSPKPDDGEDEDLEPLPDPLSIDIEVEGLTNVFVTWQYQNNSRILGYKLTSREFAEDNAEVEKLILNLKKTNYTFNNLNLGSNYIICVGIILDDDSILTDSKSCKEVSIVIDTTRPPIGVMTPANNLDEGFPILPVIGTCIAVVITLVIILVIVIVCLKRKPKKEEDKYMDERLRDKMGMWVNSFNYSGGVNEQIAEQTTVEVDIFAPVDVTKKKKEGRKSNGHVAS